MVKTYKDLVAWQKAVQLVKEVYRITEAFPSTEVYGLVSQFRRAIVSVPSNMAEGSSRNSTKEFIRFLYIAKGSLMEAETQLIIAKELGMISDSDFVKVEDMIEEVSRITFYLIKGLNEQKDEIVEIS